MRQLTFIKPGQLEWQDVPAPSLQSDTDAIVRPIAVARCDLDLLIATGAAPFAGPFAFGHEMIGVVVDAGAKAAVRPGDTVIVPFQISCGDCTNCKHGLTNACTSVPRLACYGMKPLSGHEYGGALSELVRVPFANHMLVHCPKGVDPIHIASAPDNIPDAWRAVAPHLKERPGATVLIVGGGARSIGLYAAGAAVTLGAGRVLYLDDDAGRRAIAVKFAAVAEPLSLKDRRPKEQFDITVDASGDVAALQYAVASTAANGVCTSVAIYYGDNVAIPMMRMYTKGITFHTGRVHARATIPGMLDHIACGNFHPELVTSRVVPFAQAADAMTDPGPKIVFTNDR